MSIDSEEDYLLGIKDPHLIEIEDIEKALNSNIIEGLSDEEALSRLSRFGPNTLLESKVFMILILSHLI